MLPSVLTLLGFSASDPVIADTGAIGVMGLPFGMLGGASDPTSPPPPPPPSVEESRGGDGYHRQYRKGEKRKRGLEWDKPAEDLEDRLRKAYARIMGEELPAPAVEEVAAAVKPHLEAPSDTKLPPVQAVDWSALAGDLSAVSVLLNQYQQMLDDEDWLAVIMLS